MSVPIDNRLLVVIIIVAVIIIVLLIIGWAVSRSRRTTALKERFGPEYDRAAREIGVGRAESVLDRREKRVQKFAIRNLTVDERERFITEWRLVQSRFVDAPEAAVRDAHRLLDQLMQTRGYPVADFEQKAADISVDHPKLVDNLRAAHEIALRHDRGEATTEDLRNAMIYYRSLFDDLLETTTAGQHRKEVA